MATFNVKLLENFIDYSSLRNKIISKNISNIGTAGYQREDVDFKDVLIDNLTALKTTEPEHIAISPQQAQLNVTEDKSGDMVSGVNNVNIDEEMAELAKNTIQFKLASKKISEHFKILQSVISGGGES